MRIYITHSANFDFKNELYAPILSSELNKIHQITLPYKEKLVSSSSKDFIGSQDLIIAEVSYHSTGQGIELGWANDRNIPIACILKRGSMPSRSLKTVTGDFFEYDTDTMLSVIEKVIVRFSSSKK